MLLNNYYPMKATIKQHDDFKLLIKNGKKKVLNTFIISYLEFEQYISLLQKQSKHRAGIYCKQNFLFGILTSKKFGEANKRNYFKRVVRSNLGKYKLEKFACIILPNLKNINFEPSIMKNDFDYFFKLKANNKI